MAGNPYYAGTYWARSYFGGGGDAPEGSIYATISGASQLSVSFTAVAFISANISGFAMVVADAETAGGVRDIAATLLGSSTVSANLTIPGHVVDLQKPIGGGGGSGGTPRAASSLTPGTSVKSQSRSSCLPIWVDLPKLLQTFQQQPTWRPTSWPKRRSRSRSATRKLCPERQ